MHSKQRGCALTVPALPPDRARRGAGEHLRFLNREVRARSALQSDEAFLDVQAPLAALAAAPAAATGAEPGGSNGGAGARAALPLCLLDTPGPNEAGEDGLRFQARRPRAFAPGVAPAGVVPYCHGKREPGLRMRCECHARTLRLPDTPRGCWQSARHTAPPARLP
jgi:hypothetical protein